MTKTTNSASESLAQRIIAKIFADHFKPELYEVAFRRDELITAAEALGEPRPKNLGDIVYSLRYRVPLPDSVRKAAPPNTEWAIFPGGNAVYVLRAVPFNLIEPRKGIRTVRLADSTPSEVRRQRASCPASK